MKDFITKNKDTLLEYLFLMLYATFFLNLMIFSIHFWGDL